MEQEHQYDEILVKYLLNECNAAQRDFVENWIGEADNNRLYFFNLANTLQLFSIKENIGTIDINEEWANFQRLKDRASDALSITDTPSGDDIISEGSSKKGSYLLRYLLRTAVAAAVISVVFLGVWLKSKMSEQTSIVASNSKNSSNATVMAPRMKLYENNTTGSNKTVSLPDGSDVMLYNNSELTYEEPADGKRREITIKGKADFRVAKDKTRPFVVFSGDIFTTALGTRFLVTALPDAKQYTIRLFEGSVVIRSGKVGSNKALNDQYLVPGQELVYNVLDRSALVRRFETGRAADKKTELQSTENPAIPNYSNRSWFMFNNQSLSSTFDALSEMYEAKISYSKADIQKVYFIGSFEKSDSLDFILKQIAAINNLEIIKERSGYSVRTK
jgi:transmembrane sensor